jgi:hypothetical protein
MNGPVNGLCLLLGILSVIYVEHLLKFGAENAPTEPDRRVRIQSDTITAPLRPKLLKGAGGGKAGGGGKSSSSGSKGSTSGSSAKAPSPAPSSSKAPSPAPSSYKSSASPALSSPRVPSPSARVPATRAPSSRVVWSSAGRVPFLYGFAAAMAVRPWFLGSSGATCQQNHYHYASRCR